MARGLSRRLAVALHGHGAASEEREVGAAARDGLRFDPDAFDGADALVALGGDGTLNALAPVAIRTQTPLYHVPLGNANLFAKTFGMRRDPATVARHLVKGSGPDRRQMADVIGLSAGDFAGIALVTAGIGADAEVARAVGERRTRAAARGGDGGVTDRSYLGPIAAQLLSPTRCDLEIEADDGMLRERGPGWLVVANAGRYAANLDPCGDAEPDDGLLHALFMPVRSNLELAAWGGRLLLKRAAKHPQALRIRGRSLRVRARPAAAFQVDGEPAGIAERFAFEVRSGVLPVVRTSGAHKQRDRP